jgi:hypothetical protein
MELRLTPADWQRLRLLRDRFLADASENYWTPRDLELYDAVYAQRVGWKWDAVLASLSLAGWTPAARKILDWGCGTGIASRAVAEWSDIRSVELFDQSAAAVEFAAGKLRQSGVEVRRRSIADTIESGTLLLLSHVVGELDAVELARLGEFASTASEVIWVEPGSHELSRRLGSIRQTLLAAGHRMIAPCTVQRTCPMFEPENARHWCHFFAKPPPEAFQSPLWREVSTRIGIDLRSLPYSYLTSSKIAEPHWPARAERRIGHARELKAECQLLCCGEPGLSERALQRRDDPELFRKIVKKGTDGVFVWEPNLDKPGRVCGGRTVDEPPAYR